MKQYPWTHHYENPVEIMVRTEIDRDKDDGKILPVPLRRFVTWEGSTTGVLVVSEEFVKGNQIQKLPWPLKRVGRDKHTQCRFYKARRPDLIQPGEELESKL